MLAAAWGAYVVFAWLTADSLREQHGNMTFRDCFTPGLVDTAETIRARGTPRAFGPHHDASPYVFHRLNEMLYPIPYYTPYIQEQLGVGDVYVLLPDQEPRVTSEILCASGLFRVMEVSP